MSPYDLTIFDSRCRIDTLLRTKFVNARNLEAIDSLRSYTFGPLVPTFEVDAETGEEIEGRELFGSFDISNIDNCIKVNNTGFIAESNLDKFYDTLKRIVATSDITLEQFRAVRVNRTGGEAPY